MAEHLHKNTCKKRRRVYFHPDAFVFALYPYLLSPSWKLNSEGVPNGNLFVFCFCFVWFIFYLHAFEKNCKNGNAGAFRRSLSSIPVFIFCLTRITVCTGILSQPSIPVFSFPTVPRYCIISGTGCSHIRTCQGAGCIRTSIRCRRCKCILPFHHCTACRFHYRNHKCIHSAVPDNTLCH